MTLVEQIEARILGLHGAPLILTDDEIDALDDAAVAHLVDRYGGTVLLAIPPRERRFFDWLHTADEAVWNDLWEDDTELLVTLAYIRDFRTGGPGFLICDLQGTPNYFFTPRHIKPDGLAALEGILDRASRGGELSIGEAFMFEIVSGATDLWHFCYKHGVPPASARRAVAELAANDWIVHLPDSADLVRYIE